MTTLTLQSPATSDLTCAQRLRMMAALCGDGVVTLDAAAARALAADLENAQSQVAGALQMVTDRLESDRAFEIRHAKINTDLARLGFSMISLSIVATWPFLWTGAPALALAIRSLWGAA